MDVGGSPVLVTGGTGTLGRAVVRALLAAGHRPRVLSRRGRSPHVPAAVGWVVGDLLTGDGLEEALAGAPSVVHCASDPRRPAHDVTAAGHLLGAARDEDLAHLLYVSIVGVDQVPYRYYRVKLEVEQMVIDSGVPWTVQRATQFHDFVAAGMRMLSAPPVMLLPAGVSVQSVDVREVADRIVALVEAGPSGRAPDLGGPQVLPIEDAARAWLAAIGRRRPVWSVPLPGKVVAGFRGGGHLTPEHADGRRTWADHLAALR